MTWSTGVTDLRVHLSDGATDRFRYRKRCFGEVNGSNLTFKTYEFRRVTDFTLATSPEGVYLNGVLVPATGIASDFINEGVFTLTSAYLPVDGQYVEASYYIQWFLDSELDGFLQRAALSELNTSDYTTLSGGLITAAIEIASSFAYAKMAQRWREYLSSNFKVEDEPEKQVTGPVENFIQLAKEALDRGLQIRDDYYTRQGRAKQPLFANIKGCVRNFP